MKRKILAALCFTLMLASLAVFTGCGNSGGGSSSSVNAVNPLPTPSVDCGGESCIK